MTAAYRFATGPPIVKASRPGAEPEVEHLDVGILAQRLGLAFQRDAAVLQVVTVIGKGQRHGGVLLGEQEPHSVLGVEPGYGGEDLLGPRRGARPIDGSSSRIRAGRAISAPERGQLLPAARDNAGLGVAAPGRHQAPAGHVDAVGPRAARSEWGATARSVAIAMRSGRPGGYAQNRFCPETGTTDNRHRGPEPIPLAVRAASRYPGKIFFPG